MELMSAIDTLVTIMVNDKEAPNYKGWIVEDSETKIEYVVTVQGKEGETPSQQLDKAKMEIAEYRGLLEQIVDMGAMSLYQLDIIERLLAKHKGD